MRLAFAVHCPSAAGKRAVWLSGSDLFPLALACQLRIGRIYEECPGVVVVGEVLDDTGKFSVLAPSHLDVVAGRSAKLRGRSIRGADDSFLDPILDLRAVLFVQSVFDGFVLSFQPAKFVLSVFGRCQAEQRGPEQDKTDRHEDDIRVRVFVLQSRDPADFVAHALPFFEQLFARHVGIL